MSMSRSDRNWRRRALALAASIALAALMLPSFSAPTQAVMASPPTCYPNRAKCLQCIETEVMRDGSQRCTKCGRIPHCRARPSPPTRPPWR